MFENWFSPVKPDIQGPAAWKAFQFGSNLRIFEKKLPALKDVRICLVGIGAREANAVRKSLYRMSFPFDGLRIADLGNIRRKSIPFLIPALRELLDSHIFPILIGGDPTFTLAQYNAFHSLQRLITMVLVDERIRLDARFEDDDDNFLNELVRSKASELFHLAFIGTQTHYHDPALFRFIEERTFDCVRLGNARAKLSDLEPIIRDADLFSFNLSAIKQADAPGVPEASPSGFFLEEACQICRYAGMSDKLKSFGVFGFQGKHDQHQQTPQAVAQLIWYFIDGFYHRKNDFPASLDGLTEYIVDFKDGDFHLTFWKSQKSGRWWMQVPVKNKKKYGRHRLVPCSYNDYKLACQEELPERLLNALKRFS